MATKQELINGVKAHAQANYNEGGWDHIVEAYEDSEIAELIDGATTVAGAIEKAWEIVEILGQRDRFVW